MAVEYRASDMMRLLLRRWWVVALGIALGIGAGFGALQLATPTYTATATQLVKGIPGGTTGANYIAAQFAVARAKSYPAFIYAQPVLDGVRSDLGVRYSDSELRSQLRATNPIDTPLIDVTAQATTATEAQQLANSAAEHLAVFIAKIETIDGKSPVVISTAVEAELPASPSSPRRSLYLAMGAASGFATGLIVALVIAALGGRASARRAPREADSAEESHEIP